MWKDRTPNKVTLYRRSSLQTYPSNGRDYVLQEGEIKMYAVFDRLTEWFILPVLMILILLMTLVLPYAIYLAIEESRSPVFTLKKDSWVCTLSRTETHHQYNASLKMAVPVTTTSCIEWSRK
jgi:hypothetical protein